MKENDKFFTTSIYLNDPKTHAFGRISPNATTAYTGGFAHEFEQSKVFDFFDEKMRQTNYETALEFGQDPYAGYPIPKLPKVITIPPKKAPIVINTKPSSVPATRRELPLVDPIGSFASSRRLDDKGALRIAKQKTKRFDSYSYLTTKPFD